MIGSRRKSENIVTPKHPHCELNRPTVEVVAEPISSG